ncbi:MAG: hypothetical protein M3247_00740 [Thermoproteota archaeon]|nr:hypothetical protein [Thermoproteota archaeon]
MSIYRHKDMLKMQRTDVFIGNIRIYKRNSTFVELPSLVEEMIIISTSKG